MNILIIDTAAALEIIAASKGSAVSNASAYVSRSHAASMFANIASCLEKLGIGIRDIGLVGVGIGPGSFTGIRIAVSTARMIAQVLRIPIVGVPSQELYAAGCDVPKGSNILVAFDAKKNRVFGALYKKSGGIRPDEIIPPGDYSIAHLLNGLDERQMTAGVGDGIEKYYEEVSGEAKNLRFIEKFRPESGAMIELVRERYLKNPSAFSNLHEVVPRYARKSDAEIAAELKVKTSL